ncbi:MAG: type II toxin-antitoxin system HicA family toxin [Acetobacteraceae bacterium]|nr:type II toxin-antitoxin system HicA family toxin [Acetobacteraceae bacterium]
MTAREAANRLPREGWAPRPGKGSHTVYKKTGHPIAVLPNHPGDLAPGTLRSLCAAAGWEYPPHR